MSVGGEFVLDLELATRSPVMQSPVTQRQQSVAVVRSGQPALSGRITGVDATDSDKPVMIMAVIAIVMTLATGLTASFLSASVRGQSSKLTTEVTTLQQQLRTGPLAEKLHRQETVAKQMATLTGFLADATPWPSLLDSLAGLVPPGTKLTTINIDAEQSVRLEGEAGSEQEVSVFMAALDASPNFSTPRLDSLSRSESVDGTLMQFSIASRYAPEKTEPVATVQQQAPEAATPSGPDAGSPTP